MATTEEDIQRVTNVSTDVSLFKTLAEQIVTSKLQSKGLSEETLDAITLYFAAHLVVLSDEAGGLRRSKTGEADESYRVPGDKDIGLASTRFGQMAMLLDSSGTLASMSANKGLRAQFELVGTHAS